MLDLDFIGISVIFRNFVGKGNYYLVLTRKLHGHVKELLEGLLGSPASQARALE